MLSRIRNPITEYKEIKYLAYHDALTGLLNRNWLYKNIDSIDHTYVFFIDINDLKVVNKKGHTYGDAHIRNVIEEIAYSLEVDDILIRYAGDEFVLFTNQEHPIRTNKLYAVGKCVLNSENLHVDVISGIRIADGNMIESKELYKNKK